MSLRPDQYQQLLSECHYMGQTVPMAKRCRGSPRVQLNQTLAEVPLQFKADLPSNSVRKKPQCPRVGYPHPTRHTDCLPLLSFGCFLASPAVFFRQPVLHHKSFPLSPLKPGNRNALSYWDTYFSASSPSRFKQKSTHLHRLTKVVPVFLTRTLKCPSSPPPQGLWLILDNPHNLRTHGFSSVKSVIFLLIDPVYLEGCRNPPFHHPQIQDIQHNACCQLSVKHASCARL